MPVIIWINGGFGAGKTTLAQELHRHPAQGDPDRSWLHVSGGLGTSPWAPFRFACRPEASVLTLIPRIG